MYSRNLEIDKFKSVDTHIPGFVEHRSNRKNRMGGGTAIYVRDEYTVLRSEKFSNAIVECQLVKIEELQLTLINMLLVRGGDTTCKRNSSQERRGTTGKQNKTDDANTNSR